MSRMIGLFLWICLALPGTARAVQDTVGLEFEAAKAGLAFDGSEPAATVSSLDSDLAIVDHLSKAVTSPFVEPVVVAVDSAKYGWNARKKIVVPFPFSAVEDVVQVPAGGLFAVIGAVAGAVVGVAKGFFGFFNHMGQAAGIW